MESNRAARTMFDTLLENCIFYISQLYEFSHRLGQSRRFRDVRVTSAYAPRAATKQTWKHFALVPIAVTGAIRRREVMERQRVRVIPA
jgi:hypothetical protein